nr:MAG TPA: hypothetical protein [Bacteriophage sp.]
MTISRIDQLDALSLHCRAQFVRLSEMLQEDFDNGTTRTLFLVFETFRTPDRQAQVRAEGASQVGPWQSAHAWGFAADFVPYMEGIGWSWDDDHDWDHLDNRAKLCGLRRPITWDRPHIEHPDWQYAKSKLIRK